MIIIIKDEDYQYCELGASNLWCSNKSGVYGRGMINNKNDPKRVERVGNLGEFAFASYLGIDKPKFEYKSGGIAHDFSINGFTINVKCASKDYGAVLIKCYTEKGTYVFQDSDFFVACCLRQENREKKYAEIDLVGWVDLDYIKQLQPVESPRWNSKHKNYKIDFTECKKIHLLKNKIYDCCRTTSI